MKLPGWDVLIWVLVLMGFGIYGLMTLSTAEESSVVIHVTLAVMLIVTGLLLLIRFRWSPEVFVLAFMSVGAWNVVRLVTEGYTLRRLVITIGCVVVPVIWYSSLRRAIRRRV
jgi:hypothetical protein